MIKSVLFSHLSRYPAMQIQDIYKLLHQATLGSEHAISDPLSARQWLTRELAEMGSGPSEPLIDPITDDGSIVRVHLRPFIAAGYDPDSLLDAFVRTANEYHGDIRTLKQDWQVASDMRIFPVSEMDKFFASMKAKKYPAVHHTPTFQKLYRPAYRVIALSFGSKAWQ